MTYSIIQKSQLEGAERLDAEYYQPDFLNIRKTIMKIGFLNLKDIIVNFGSGKNLKQTKDGQATKFIRTQNVRPILIDDNCLSFTEEKQFPITNYGDLLFVRVGEGVGNSSVISKEFENSAFSDNVIRVKISKINPFYVSILLNSKIGDLLMAQIKKGSARSLISKENLDSIKIPKISEKDQKHFEDKINQSELEILKSKKLFFQAEDLLLEELGLKDFKPEEKNFSVVNLSEIQTANRIDAEYFQPKYKFLTNKLKQGNPKFLSEVIRNIAAKFNPLIEAEKEFDYVELANINSSIGIIDGSTRLLGKEAPSRAKRLLKASDVIISSVEGSLEKVALVDDSQEGYLASTGFFQLQSKKILPAVLLVLAKSIVFQYQLQQRCAGTILTAVPQDSIKDILVPILLQKTQQKIADLVKKSHAARKKAKELLGIAKKKVEDIIKATPTSLKLRGARKKSRKFN